MLNFLQRIKIYSKQTRGFVLMLSVIMLSVILATSLGVFNLIYQGMKLSGTTRESQLAYYAADAGVECALYVDFRGATSFGMTMAPSVAADCGEYKAGSLKYFSGASYVNGAIFTINYANGSCVDVAVDKTSATQTKLSAVGKNTCGQATDQVNRSLEVKY